MQDIHYMRSFALFIRIVEDENVETSPPTSLLVFVLLAGSSHAIEIKYIISQFSKFRLR